MKYLFAFEFALYFCTLLLFAKYILDCTPRRVILILSFLLLVPLLIFEQSGNDDYVAAAGSLFIIVQFPVLRLIYPKAKIRYLLFFFLFMNCLNIMLISIFIRFFGANGVQMEIISNLLTAAVWCGICLSGLRHKLRQTLLYTPKYVLFVSGILFVAMIMVDTSSSAPSVSAYPEAWAKYQDLGVGLLRLAVCIAFPVFIIVSASNSRLKLLTVSYEQQIHAQAEHYKALSDANWEVRRFRHDFKNTRIAIEKLLADGDQAQALRLLQECGDVLNAPNRNIALFDTGNGIADALLTDKQNRAAKHNTVIIFRGSIPQNALAPTDLCVILGNTIDNALEACEKLSPGVDRSISVTSNCSSGFLFLTIQNPTAEKVTVRDDHIATTKRDKTLHGFGLLSLRSVVNKYDGTLRLSSNENCFTASIDLCLSNSVSS